jgi:rare lipoprotein A
MNQKFWSGLTTAALTTVLGTTVSLLSSSNRTIASTVEANPVNLEQSSIETKDPNLSNNPLRDSTENVNGDQQLSPGTTERENKAIVSVYPHQWKGISASTLRIQNIPVLTFLGSSKARKPSPKTNVAGKDNKISSVTDFPSDPVARASALAERLSELLEQDDFNANQIVVRRDAATRTYKILINREELVTIDDKTILPDTTHNSAKDALQIANRLRRLLGEADPLEEIIDQTDKPMEKPGLRVRSQTKGIASWYGPGFHGRRTANGERYNQFSLTAAHKSLPFGTKVRVTNVNNGRSIIVRINDRGPYSGRRIIDLSAGAAKAVGLSYSGVGLVKLEILEP